MTIIVVATPCKYQVNVSCVCFYIILRGFESESEATTGILSGSVNNKNQSQHPEFSKSLANGRTFKIMSLTYVHMFN